MNDVSVSKGSLNLLRVIFAAIVVVMTYTAIKTSLESDLFTAGPRLWAAEAWFRATLYDFYFNIFIISCWVFYKERSKLIASVWVVAFVVLGSIATAFYVLRQLFSIKPGDPLSRVLLKNT